MTRRTRQLSFALALLGGACLAVLAIAGIYNEPARADDNTGAVSHYLTGLRTLDSSLARLDAALASGDPTAARIAFRSTRTAYKRVELFVEYYGTLAVRELNGPPIPKAEDEDPETPLPPVGLQVVEGMVFPELSPRDTAHARQLVTYMRAAVAVLARVGVDTMPGDAYIFDAMRHEIARVATLGIAGFDATISGDGIIESAEALTGVREVLRGYARHPSAASELQLADAVLDSAITYLQAHPSFDDFDRLTFIARYAGHAAYALTDAQRLLAIGPPDKPRAWSARASNIYGARAFDAMFFAATDAPAVTPPLVALGRELFFDAALSPSGERSCASCHVPERAFTDGRARARLLDIRLSRPTAGTHAAGRAARNTPTLVNAALQPALFADNRVRTLEDQATDVLGSPGEMGGSLAAAATALRQRGTYDARFARVFPDAGDTALTPRTLRLALAAYVRSLVALDSPFDRAVRGDTSALTAEERHGFNVFMGRAKCGTCHFAPLFHGALPPTLVESEPEVIGVPRDRVARQAVVDSDSGRFNVRGIDQHLHAFKTPTLRNVALTAPYMHNGVFRTLEEVIDFYDAGGGHGLGIRLAHQTLPTDSLHLSDSEKRELVAFLRTLTDTAGLTGRPR